MDIQNAIRAGIFLVAGILTIIFRKELNAFKNKMLKKFGKEGSVKEERKVYLFCGVGFIIISVILLVVSVAY
mgnify:CR=1 FL=1|jgi:hypothetical protein